MELKLFFNNLKANIDHYDNVKAIEQTDKGGCSIQSLSYSKCRFPFYEAIRCISGYFDVPCAIR